MNLEGLLKYQELDKKLYDVEQKLVNNAYRKKANELAQLAKKAQAKSAELEAEADKLITEIEQIKKNYEINKKKSDEMVSTNIENLKPEDLDKLMTLKGKIMSNLNILEKMLQKSAERINAILSDFNKTKKVYDEARVQFAACKGKIDELGKQYEPEKQKIKNDLLALEKDVDKAILADYKKIRNDTFPVIVPLTGGNFCGGCHMELPKIAVSHIKEKGMIVCEHCKRFIYQK